MLKRFAGYYKPHIGLFLLDMGVAILSAVLSIFFPILTRTLLKTYVPDHNVRMIIISLIVMLLVFLFRAIFNYIRIRWGHILGVRMEYDMRADIFSHIQKLSFTYFDNTKTGHIMSRISNDLNMIAEVAHHAPEDLLISILIIAGSFIAMFQFNSTLALFTLIPVPLLLLWGLTFGRKMKSGFRTVRKRIADINSSVENSVQGIREVKSYANEEIEIDKFSLVNDNFRIAKEIMYKLMAIFHGGMSFLTDFYYLFVIGAGCWLMFRGKIDVADLMAFTLYINFILNPINRLVNFVEQFQQGAAAFERFLEIMDIEPDIEDKPGAVALAKVKGRVELKNVFFRYTETTDWILQDISIDVEAGKTIALVGESGAGKSTIVSLIPRFYEVQQGQILLDGRDIMDIRQSSLRENIGIVQQNIFLFDTTIRENILYGNPAASEEELIDAAKKANIYDFIDTLSEKFDTLVGERGVKLSGGQKQRISIARAFLKNPPVLIFDEATSSLDSESEAHIQAAMEELAKNRTTIIIAHRLSTVRKADLLYVIRQGRLIEAGSHQQLMEKKDYYYSLYTRNLL
ncbi:MAG: ABC transporter ATP-binding protein/permease [Candidatus Cloacimonetes bacterium]|nr:ABC transporter ATP-binding protein/permease [Candidatus Cloacimonadota bacterium]